jgi:hypothetical protein
MAKSLSLTSCSTGVGSRIPSVEDRPLRGDQQVARAQLQIHGISRDLLIEAADDLSQESVGVVGLGHDVHPGLVQEVHDALPGEHGVVGHDYPHGITTWTRDPSMASRPPSAPTRSRMRSRSSGLSPVPSSTSSTSSSVSMGLKVATMRDADRRLACSTVALTAR